MAGHEPLVPDPTFYEPLSSDDQATSEMRLADIRAQVTASLSELLASEAPTDPGVDRLPPVGADFGQAVEDILDSSERTTGPLPEIPVDAGSPARRRKAGRLAGLIAVGLLVVGLPSGAYASHVFGKTTVSEPLVEAIPTTSAPATPGSVAPSTPSETATQSQSPAPSPTQTPAPAPTPTPTKAPSSAAPSSSKAPLPPGAGEWKQMTANPSGWSFSLEFNGKKWMVYADTGSSEKVLLVPPDAPKGIGYVLGLNPYATFNGLHEVVKANGGSRVMDVAQGSFDGLDVYIAELGDNGTSAQSVDMLFLPAS